MQGKTVTARGLLVSILMAGITTVAQAHELTFDYTADGGFLVGTETGFPIGGTSNTVVYHNDDDSACAGPICRGINWGLGVPDSTVQSGLHLGAAAGTVTTDGPQVDFGSMLHHNSPTTESFSGTVDLTWQLALSTGGMAVDVIDLVFRIFVEETPNVPGDVDDEFTYALVSGPLSDVFEFEGESYRVNVFGFYDPLGNLTTTFFSPEGGDNTGFVRFSVDHIAVSSPEAWGLLALGMVPLVRRTRRRASRGSGRPGHTVQGV